MTAPKRAARWVATHGYTSSVLGIGLAAVILVVVVFQLQASSSSHAVESRDDTITRLSQSYAKLYDQDLSLGVHPSAPDLAQVLQGSAHMPPPLLPRSFTASFPSGYFTCTDATGAGNYRCTVNQLHPTTPTTPAKGSP